MPQSDEALIRTYREEGREEAINALVNRYVSPVYNLLTRLVGAEAAEDLTQETFLKMWKGLPGYDLEKSFKTWLFAIARNTAIDYLRKKRPTLFSRLRNERDEENEKRNFEDTLPDSASLPDELFEKKELAERLEEALKALSLDERTIIILHESDELTFEEISEVVGEPMNTVKSRYRRALQKLRAALSIAPN